MATCYMAGRRQLADEEEPLYIDESNMVIKY